VNTTVERRNLRRGDELLDTLGRPFFRVECVDQARAKGYVVVTGYRLVRGSDDDGYSPVESVATQPGHGMDLVSVRRAE
jgi:hypothetical protein